MAAISERAIITLYLLMTGNNSVGQTCSTFFRLDSKREELRQFIDEPLLKLLSSLQEFACVCYLLIPSRVAEACVPGLHFKHSAYNSAVPLLKHENLLCNSEFTFTFRHFLLWFNKTNCKKCNKSQIVAVLDRRSTKQVMYKMFEEPTTKQ